MANDAQTKGGAGAALLSGGTAILVSIGSAGLLAPFAAGFQIGYGAGMIVKAQAERPRSVDISFKTPVKSVALKIKTLPNPTNEAAPIADPANAALNDVGRFLANMRGVAIALNRHHTAKISESSDSDSAQMQLASVHTFFQSAQKALESAADNLCHLSGSIDRHPVGLTLLDVSEVTERFQRDLATSGFPEIEEPFIETFRLSDLERKDLIDTLLSVSPEQTAAMFGSEITFSVLIAVMAENAREIASNLAEIIELPPSPCSSRFLGEPCIPPEPIELRLKQVKVGNSVRDLKPDEAAALRKFPRRDLRPLIWDRSLVVGRNPYFVDHKSGDQFWIDFDGDEMIKYGASNASGEVISSELVRTRDANGIAICHFCRGGVPIDGIGDCTVVLCDPIFKIPIPA